MITDTYEYGPYGEQIRHMGTTQQPFQYNGRDGVATDANGLYHMRARYYNPEIKRFINRDVLTGSISDSQTLNRYAYVNGNPISYVDPFGLSRDGDSAWLQGGSFLADLVPWVGTVKGFQQAFTGNNYITGEHLSAGDRWGEGIGATLSIIPIPGLKHAGKYGTKGVIWAGSKLKNIFGEGTVNTTKKMINACNCFTAGTKVLTDDGEKNIEDIEVGDKVLSKNEVTGEQAYKEVTHLYRNDKEITYELTVGDQIIETTENHPFWVEGKGWVFAAYLQVGDELQQSNGNTLKIDKIKKVIHDELVKVYNFTVADFHTYYVSSLGIWVHNITCAEISWKGFSSGQLKEHYEKHVIKQNEFGNITQNEYFKLAKGFAAETSSTFKEQVVGNFLVKYDPSTGRVLVGHIKDRQIRTFYKDDGRDDDPFQAAIDLAKSLGGG